MSAHISEDRLIDLSRGLLPPDQRALTLAHVGSCATCEELFRGICAANARLALAEAPPAPAARSRRAVWIAVAAAAAAIAIAVVGVWVQQRNTVRGAPEVWLPTDDERVLFRSLPDLGENAVYRQAVDAYSAHDARRVVALLDGRTVPPEYDFLRVLLASALVNDRNYDRARAVLDALRIDSLPLPYRDRARWERYLALDRSGRADEARKVLSDLASRPGAFQDQAAEALRRAPAGRGE